GDTTPEGMMLNLLPTTPGQDQPHRPTTPGPLMSPTSKKTPACQRLLRKEVIQPHLPVRLPCYDFVPIAGPTFTHSLPTGGLGHQFRVLPTFMTWRAVCTRPGNVFTAVLLIRDYQRLHLHGVELQTPIRTETGFRGFAPPC